MKHKNKNKGMKIERNDVCTLFLPVNFQFLNGTNYAIVKQMGWRSKELKHKIYSKIF